ncbi:hypothetical protein FPHOBKDP_00023 [Listeria phage LPJP1]|nr:hypothetical protein FPHOBKDP_00023 [Listeria phage LPJP1]
MYRYIRTNGSMRNKLKEMNIDKNDSIFENTVKIINELINHFYSISEVFNFIEKENIHINNEVMQYLSSDEFYKSAYTSKIMMKNHMSKHSFIRMIKNELCYRNISFIFNDSLFTNDDIATIIVRNDLAEIPFDIMVKENPLSLKDFKKTLRYNNLNDHEKSILELRNI